MRASDVNGFKTRSDAAYGTLALDYIAEQLYQQGDGFYVDAVTVVEMNDTGRVLFRKEPLDWVSCSSYSQCLLYVMLHTSYSQKHLFNLQVVIQQNPRSHEEG